MLRKELEDNRKAIRSIIKLEAPTLKICLPIPSAYSAIESVFLCDILQREKLLLEIIEKIWGTYHQESS